MIRAFKRLTVTLAFLFLMTGCQAMTGQTAGQNIDDSVHYDLCEDPTRIRQGWHPDTCGS